MKYLTTVFSLIYALTVQAQVESGLVTWLSFDKAGCEISDELNDPNVITFQSDTSMSCDCGVRNNSLFFDGIDDWFYLFGNPVENSLSTTDFSLSFYFKSLDSLAQSVALFSKRTGCSTDTTFAIRYNPLSRVLNVDLNENNALSGSLSKKLPLSCWYHIVVVRNGGTTLLYVNGEEAAKVTSAASQRVNIKNSPPLTVGDSECSVDELFYGLMDEIRLYDRAISRDEVRDLYFAPDQLSTGDITPGVNDTTIFLGSSVQAYVTNTCADQFAWSPIAGVSDPAIPNPLITPTDTTLYVLEFEGQGCKTTDSLLILVVDPATVDCNDIMLPTAFSPNEDGLNDRYGMSNPFVAGEIITFDIYDRWGNIVFQTTDSLEKWDGSYKNQPVNPGVFLYKIRFKCKGEEGIKTGSVTVIR